jgi:hypothetical protein
MQLDASDFHGKELSLKLNEDGNLGNLESSSGNITGMDYSEVALVW